MIRRELRCSHHNHQKKARTTLRNRTSAGAIAQPRVSLIPSKNHITWNLQHKRCALQPVAWEEYKKIKLVVAGGGGKGTSAAAIVLVASISELLISQSIDGWVDR